MDPPPPEGVRGWRRLLAPTCDLSAADAALVEDERVALNVARVRTATPVLAAIMLAAGLVTLVVTPVNEAAARWLRGVLMIDLTGSAAAVAMYAIARVGHPHLRGLRRRLGELFMVLSVLIGAVLAANTAQYQFRMAAWLIGVMMTTILVHPRGWVTVIAQLAGLTVVTVACLAAYPDADSRIGQLSVAFAFALLQVVFARVTFASFVRECVARVQLARANHDLASRVATQVGEIVESTHRIETLNRQLAGQVKARSDELAAALRRLVVAEHGDGPLDAGTVVSDRFELGCVLGVGGMGVVYAAHDRLAEQPVALKVVRAQLRDVNEGYRFLQEATAAASLSHAAIVRVLHVGVTGEGRLFQALELITGQTLEAYLIPGRIMPAPVVARLGGVVADALASAHGQGVIHRDVKPTNIMLTPEPPGCRLLDFGLAKLRESLTASALTEHGAVVGTPQFLAPEQVSRPDAVGGGADVYALGMVLYLAASGRPAFDAVLPMQWLFAHVHLEPAPLPDTLPAALRDLISRCLSKAAADRPDAGNLAAALTRLADELGAPALHTWAADVAPDDTAPEILGEVAIPAARADLKRPTGA